MTSFSDAAVALEAAIVSAAAIRDTVGERNDPKLDAHDAPRVGTIDSIQRATGFVPFFLNDGEVGWICPSCWTKLEPAFIVLDAVLGDLATHEPIDLLVRHWRNLTGRKP